MPDRRGLGAALAGALKGAVGVQQQRRGRQEELADQQARQQHDLQRLALIEALRESSQGREQAGRLQRDEARRLAELKTSLAQAAGTATGLGFSFPDVLEGDDPDALRGRLANVLGAITAKEQAAKSAKAEAEQTTFKLSPGQVLLDEEGRVIASNPRPDRDDTALPSLASFTRRIQELQETTDFRDGLTQEQAIRQAAMEFFGIDPTGLKFRGQTDLFNRLLDMFEAASALGR